VHHYNQSREFAWSRHAFKVLADKEEGRFECECKLWEHTGLFCHHVIAVFEHLRLDKIPPRYILQRYMKNPVKDPDFNRRDYKTAASAETTLPYRRTILYSEAMKTVNKGCLSDKMFNIVLAAFREVNMRMDCDEMETHQPKGSSPEHGEGDTKSAPTGKIPESGSVDRDGNHADIQLPLKSKTKGSRANQSDE
jgi:hypothetical protein